MTRTISSLNEEQILSDTLAPVILFYADFPTGAVRAWTGVGDLVWDGDTYLGVGNLGSVSSIEETISLQAVGDMFSLSGIKAESLTQVLNDDIQGRDCVVYIGFLDSYGQLIDDPITLFKGLMDVLSIYESANSTYVSIDAESLLRDFEGTRTRRLTDQDQKSEYPGDRGLEYVASLQEAEIFWGREYEK
jgi:hypothetical protein